MGQLRDQWQQAKSQSETAFQHDHRQDLLHAHTQPPTPYPLKFELKLGPKLDDVEKLQYDKKKYDELRTKVNKALETVGRYRLSVREKKQRLGDNAERPLTAALDKIDQRLRGMLGIGSVSIR